MPDLPANNVSRGYCHGLKIDQAVRITNDIVSEYDPISLTVAEPMPRTAIKIKNILCMLAYFNRIDINKTDMQHLIG